MVGRLARKITEVEVSGLDNNLCHFHSKRSFICILVMARRPSGGIWQSSHDPLDADIADVRISRNFHARAYGQSAWRENGQMNAKSIAPYNQSRYAFAKYDSTLA